MYSVGARTARELDGQPGPVTTQRIRELCGNVTPRFHDDGSFSITTLQEEEAQRIQDTLKQAGFRMRDRKPWRVAEV